MSIADSSTIPICSTSTDEQQQQVQHQQQHAGKESSLPCSPASSPSSKHPSPITSFAVRPATADDIGTMARQQCAMAMETEGRDIAPEVHSVGLSLALLRTKLSYAELFLAEAAVAAPAGMFPTLGQEQGKEVCGMFMIRPEFSLLRNATVHAIEDVFTEQKFRGKGVFRHCFNAIHDKYIVDRNAQIRRDAAVTATATAATNTPPSNNSPLLLNGIRLFVNKANEGAIAVYKRVGMFMEKGRLFRWCKEGWDVPRMEPSAEDLKRFAITPVSARPNEDADAFGKAMIRRAKLVGEPEQDEILINKLSQIIWSNSKAHHRFANEVPGEDSFDRKYKLENLKKAVRFAIQSTTSVVTESPVSPSTPNSNDLRAELYVLADDSGAIHGCFMLTFEFCTWRRGFIIWMHNFSVANEFASRRGEIFRSTIRYLQRVVEDQRKEDAEERIAFASVRFELDPDVESQQAEAKNNLVQVAQDEAFEFEQDLLMRIEYNYL